MSPIVIPGETTQLLEPRPSSKLPVGANTSMDGPKAPRKRYMPPDVKWSASMSVRCKQHALYLKANRNARGADAAQVQADDARLASRTGSLFAQMAIVATKAGKPRKEIDRWMSWPGYRDAILNNKLGSVGIYAEGGIMVMHTIGGNRTGKERVPLATYPWHQQKAVPTDVPVKELGWDVRKLLEEKGHGKLKTVGFPISMHIGGLGKFPDSYKCRLAADRGDVVKGLVHRRGSNRRSSGPGVVVFIPLTPLKRGTLYEGAWTWDRMNGGRQERAEQKLRFTTR